MRISKTAAFVALLVAQPFTILATCCWVTAAQESTSVMGREYLYLFGDAIYLYFGYPLTHIIFIFREYGHLQLADDWWAIPLVNVLFIGQWFIWGQFLAVIGKIWEWLVNRSSRTIQKLSPVPSEGNGSGHAPYLPRWAMPNNEMQPTATSVPAKDEEARGG